jgi:pyroglutamyl-peptidase
MGQSRRAPNRNAAPPAIAAKRAQPRSATTRNSAASEGLILLGGFEPFHGERHNPSRDVVRALDGELIGGLRVKALELPVVYTRAARLMTGAIARIQPAAVLGLGQAGGRTVITLERIAINLLDGPHPDNDGRRKADAPVVRGGPDAYFARLPLRGIMQALKRRRIPATLSLSAGAFMCNAVMYAALHELRRQPDLPCGFVHLPYDTRQAMRHLNAPSMPLEMMIEAVRTAIVTIGKSLT